jgi:hypothetical protein
MFTQQETLRRVQTKKNRNHKNITTGKTQQKYMSAAGIELMKCMILDAT